MLGGDVEVGEGEVGEAVLVAAGHGEEGLALEGAVLHGDVVGVGERHVGAPLEVEELGPGLDVEEVGDGAGDAVDGDVLVALGGVGPHLEPEEAGGVSDADSAQDDVAVVD